MRPKKTRRQFTKEFKAEAVKLCENRTLSEVSKSIGVSVSVLGRWCRATEGEASGALSGGGKRILLEEENRQLRKRVLDLEEDKEILKKAAAYFAKNQK